MAAERLGDARATVGIIARSYSQLQKTVSCQRGNEPVVRFAESAGVLLSQPREKSLFQA